MNTPKALYLSTYRTNTGAIYSVPVSMEKEIDDNQEFQNIVGTVAKYAVAQGHVRSLDDVTITGLTLLNPSRDVNVIANELLEQSFVELYDAMEAQEQCSPNGIHSSFTAMYNSIKGIEEVVQ